MQNGEILSVNKLSKLTGLDRRTLDKRLVGVPKVKGGYTFESVMPLLNENASGQKDTKRQKEIEKLQEQIEDLRTNRAIKLRDYVKAADMKRSVGKMQIAAKQKLYSGEAAHVAEVTMKGALTAEQSEVVRSSYHAIIVDVLKELHRGEWGNPECPECKAKL